MDRKTLKIIEGLKNIHSDILPDATFSATVKDVNMQQRTCDVDTPEGITIYEVMLQAASERSTGFVIFPAVGSIVLISVTEAGNWYVSAFTGIDKLSIKSQNEDMKTLLSDLLDAIKKLTVTTSVGPSGVPINLADFEAIKQRLNNLLI